MAAAFIFPHIPSGGRADWALAVINSENRRLGQDALVDLPSAWQWIHNQRFAPSGPPAANLPLSAEDVNLLRQVRPRLRQVFHYAAGKEHQRTVNMLNTLLALHATRPTFVGQPPRLTFAVTSTQTGVAIVGAAVVGLALAVDQQGWERLGVCIAQGCQQCFMDASPQGNRRYCSNTCASRTATARHRANHHSPTMT